MTTPRRMPFGTLPLAGAAARTWLDHPLDGGWASLVAQLGRINQCRGGVIVTDMRVAGRGGRPHRCRSDLGPVRIMPDDER